MSSEQEVKVKSLEKALKVLECFLHNQSLGVSEITGELDICKSSVYNILSTFQSLDYLQQDPVTNRYSLGIKWCEYSRAVSDRFSIKKIALPYMQEIANEEREHVYLGKAYKDEVLYLESIHPVENIELMRSLMGLRVKMYCTGIGKVLMAYLPEEEFESYCALPRTRFTENTIIDSDKLREEMQKIRRNGYALDDMEHEYGIKSVAVPIFDSHGGVCAALSISGPSLRFSPERISMLAEKLKSYAAKISSQIYQ